MRAMFVSPVAAAHYRMLEPLAGALHARGHTVAFATAEPFLTEARGRGFDGLAVGWTSYLEAQRLAGTEGERWGLETRATEIFLTAAAELAGDLSVHARDWAADVLVHDRLGLGAPLAADIAGVPHVHTGLGVLAPARWMRRWEACASPIWRRYGREMPPRAGLDRFLYLDYCPPSLQVPEIADVVDVAHRVRHPILDWRPARDIVPPLPTMPQRPTVYATLGISFSQCHAFYSGVLDALAAEDVNLIMTVSPFNDPADFGPLPPNAIVERLIPQHLVLPRASLVVCHGGAATLFPALGHGLPLLLFPQGADQFHNTEQCLAAGVGERLEDLAPETVKRQVRRVLGDAGMKAAAAGMAAEMAVMPPLEGAVEHIERLADARAGPGGQRCWG